MRTRRSPPLPSLNTRSARPAAGKPAGLFRVKLAPLANCAVGPSPSCHTSAPESAGSVGGGSTLNTSPAATIVSREPETWTALTCVCAA